MGLIKLRVELGALRAAINELRGTIQEHIEAIHAAEKARTKEHTVPERLPVLVSHDEELKKGEMSSYATQEGIRKWTKRAVIAAAIYAAIAALQWYEMRTQTRQLAKQFEVQQRPWVSSKVEFKGVEFVVYPGNRPGTQFDVIVEIPTKNEGSSPAFQVGVGAMGTASNEIAATGGFTTLDKMMETACGFANSESKLAGRALFPGNSDPREIPENIMVPLIQVTEIRRLWVAACVAYSSSSTNQIHHTKIWAASWPINGQPTEIRRSLNPPFILYSLPITQWGIIKTEAD